jgi:hypothetical protein
MSRRSYVGEGNPMAGKSHSDESIKIMAAKATGRKQSSETVKRKAEASTGTKREKKLCTWCDYECPVNTYVQFHGDNCHMNPASPRYNPNKKIRNR